MLMRTIAQLLRCMCEMIVMGFAKAHYHELVVKSGSSDEHRVLITCRFNFVQITLHNADNIIIEKN